MIWTGWLAGLVFNFHWFFSSANLRSTRGLLAICGIFGFIALFDILCILTLSLLLGLWLTMALLSLISSVGVLLSYALVQSRVKAVINSTSQGLFDKEAFSSYFCALIASVLFIVPGILNTLLGIALVMRFSGVKLGEKLARSIGISWQAAYEYLRLS